MLQEVQLSNEGEKYTKKVVQQSVLQFVLEELLVKI